MSNYIFNQIDKDDSIFSSPSYDSDRLIFNYIEGARRSGNAEIFSDGKYAIICRKKGHCNIWIWTCSDKSDDIDLIIETAKKVCELNIEKPEIFIRPEVAQKFSDMYALLSKDLDYQIKDEFSLGVYLYTYKETELSDDVSIAKYEKKYNDALYDFYSKLKNEFNWHDDYIKKTLKKYTEMNTFMLLKNNVILSVVVIGNSDGKFAGVRSVATLPEYRKKGYATALISMASNVISKDGVSVMLYSNKGNKSAAAVWKKAGFKYLGDIHLIKS